MKPIAISSQSPAPRSLARLAAAAMIILTASLATLLIPHPAFARIADMAPQAVSVHR